jgi:hypothetical protein
MTQGINEGQSRELAHIDLNDEVEVSDWAKRFDVTGEQIRAAVFAVGNQVSRVRSYLQARR